MWLYIKRLILEIRKYADMLRSKLFFFCEVRVEFIHDHFRNQGTIQLGKSQNRTFSQASCLNVLRYGSETWIINLAIKKRTRYLWNKMLPYHVEH